MREQKKNESGITLVALVVSIIVMLVLAGVSLNATVGDNGIVTRAQEAKALQEAATIKEQLEMAKVEMYTQDSNFNSYWMESDDVSQFPGVDAIPEYLRDKLEVQEGELVYNPEKCSDSDIEYFKSAGIKEGNFLVQGIQVDIIGSEEASTIIGPNIAIGLDTSGSMDAGNPTRIANARSAIANIIDNCFYDDEDTRTAISVVTWNNEGDIVEGIASGRPIRRGAGVLKFGNDLEYAKNYNESLLLKQKVLLLDTVSGEGMGTKMLNGLTVTYNALEKMKEAFSDNVEFLIFLADGDSDDSANPIYAKAEEIRASGVTIYTIGYGIKNNSSAHNKLKTIAGDEEQCILANDGDATQVLEAFNKIKKKIDNIVTGINTDRGILTIDIQEGCKIDNRYPVVVKILDNTYEYMLDSLPSNMIYNEKQGNFKWNIRQYTREEQENLDINFTIIPK